jgi:hypothetical protein
MHAALWREHRVHLVLTRALLTRALSTSPTTRKTSEKQTDRQLDHAQARSPARTPRPNVTDHQLGEPLHPGEIDRCIPVLAQALASSTVAAERWVSF